MKKLKIKIKKKWDRKREARDTNHAGCTILGFSGEISKKNRFPVDTTNCIFIIINNNINSKSPISGPFITNMRGVALKLE